MTKARPGWHKIAALPSIVHHADYVEALLRFYVEDWHRLAESGEKWHHSIHHWVEFLSPATKKPWKPVCPQTVMKIFGLITGLKLRRGKNMIPAEQLRRAGDTLKAFWKWHADRGRT